METNRRENKTSVSSCFRHLHRIDSTLTSEKYLFELHGEGEKAKYKYLYIYTIYDCSYVCSGQSIYCQRLGKNTQIYSAILYFIMSNC